LLVTTQNGHKTSSRKGEIKSMARFLRFYHDQLTVRPLITKSVTSGSIFFLGDFNCQYIINYFRSRRQHQLEEQSLLDGNDDIPFPSTHEKDNPPQPQGFLRSTFLFTKWDARRSLCMATYGTFISGPLLHIWLTKLLPRIAPGTGFKSAFKKAVCDLSLGAGIMLPSFFVIITLMEGRTIEEGLAKVKKEQLNTIKVGFQFWPFVQLVNFTLVPIPYQQLVVNATSFFWTSYLSYVQHKKINHDSHAKK